MKNILKKLGRFFCVFWGLIFAITALGGIIAFFSDHKAENLLATIFCIAVAFLLLKKKRAKPSHDTAQAVQRSSPAENIESVHSLPLGVSETDTSKDHSMTIQATSLNLSELNISQHIPNEIVNLLWFSNGPFQNYFPDSAIRDFQVAGYTIHLQTAIVGEPSAIDVELPVALGFPAPTPLGYYPSYQNLTPEQRIVYLNWLSDITVPIDIGYVFIFYYGLERHLFFGDAEAAVATILVLREFHQHNSFLSYSGDALMLYALINNRPDIALRAATQKTSKDLRLLVSALCQHILSAQDIMTSHKSFSFENNRYIKANPDLFLSTLENALIERYGINAFPIQLNDFKEASRQLTLALANYSLLPAQRFIKLPDISTTPRVQVAVHTILLETHEAVKIKLREARKKDHSSAK